MPKVSGIMKELILSKSQDDDDTDVQATFIFDVTLNDIEYEDVMAEARLTPEGAYDADSLEIYFPEECESNLNCVAFQEVLKNYFTSKTLSVTGAKDHSNFTAENCTVILNQNQPDQPFEFDLIDDQQNSVTPT